VSLGQRLEEPASEEAREHPHRQEEPWDAVAVKCPVWRARPDYCMCPGRNFPWIRSSRFGMTGQERRAGMSPSGALPLP
jgi:hypothetical protein